MRARLIVFVAVIWLLLVAGVVNARLHLVRDARLYGAQPRPPRTRLDLADVWSGRWQAEVERRLSRWWGLRGLAIKTDNTINLTLFHETRPSSTVVVGDDGWLFLDEDIAFLNRADDCPGCDELAARIARTQRALAATGRVFLPILTASKTTTERAQVPARWRRFDGPPRSDAITRRLVAALRREGVEYVDGWSLEMELRRTVGPVFPREARHWSPYVACRLFTEAITVGARRLGVVVGPADTPSCTEPMASRNSTHDLGSLLNVWRQPRRRSPVELPPAPVTRTDLRPLLVGTSFLLDFAALLRRSTFGADARFYYYDDRVYRIDRMEELGRVAANDPAWRAWTLGRNLYLADLYEVYLPEAGFGPFLEQLEAALADVPYTGPSR